MKVSNRRALFSIGRIIFLHIPLISILLFGIDICLSFYYNPSKYTDLYMGVSTYANTYYISIMVYLAVALVSYIIVYLFIWRWFFPDFIRITTNKDGSTVSYPEGRVYWIDNYGFSRKIYDWLEIPEDKRGHTVYFQAKFFWNFFLPTRSLFKLDGVQLGDCSRDAVYYMEILTRGGFEYVKYHHYRIGDYPLRMLAVPLYQSTIHKDNYLSVQEGDTRQVSRSDSEMIKRQYEHTGFSVPEDIYQELSAYLPIEPLDIDVTPGGNADRRHDIGE